MTDKYILDGHTPIPCNDLMEWARWYEKADRHVRDETIGDARVSTVFLSMDHRFGGYGMPILFETMVFGGKLDGEQERCSTWDEAEAMHEEMCRKVREAQS